MRIKQSIFKRGKSGGDVGRLQNPWTLRLNHTDDRGQSTSKTWQYATKQGAKDDVENRKAELVALLESKGLDLGDIRTFKQWAEHAKKDFYRPAVIKDGRKVAGIKSSRQTHILIDQLVECFGDKRLAKFTKFDLDRYKVWRLEQGDRRGEKGKLDPANRKPVKISTANRGLAILKHLLMEAYDAGLIAKNVTRGSEAIDADAETARTRTLTDAEEKRLLDSCSGTRIIEYTRKGKDVKATITVGNPYLKAIVLLGLDAGMRRGEILKLEWADIDLDAGLIKVSGTHTKTQRSRTTPLTERAKTELIGLPSSMNGPKVFPFNDFKRSWATAVKLAKIGDFNFHDLRRTFVTRLQANGVSIGIAAELAGHSSLETTRKHYTSTSDPAIVRNAAAQIDAANETRVNQWPDTIE